MLSLMCIVFFSGSGNTFFSPAAEFNFAYDPESAYVVLNELECPKLNVSWETCLNEGMTMVTNLYL